MDQQYGEFIGVDNVHYAIHTADTEAAFTTQAPEYLAPVAEIAGSPEVSNKTTYYDNKAANNYVTEGKTELKIIVSNVPGKKAATLLGKKYDAASGRIYDSGEANPPDVALGFRFNMGKDGHRYYWYHKGTFSGGTEEAATKKEDIDEKTYELTYTAVTTTHEWDIDGEMKSLKRVFADTADPAFDPAGWFTQVQTPTTVGAPAAVALSSSVPADGASGVSKSAGIVLTFNNKIKSEAISIIDTASGDVVAVSRAWDAAGKVLTLTPSSALAGTTKHIISIAGVVDIYGQSLAASSRDFTTVA